MLDHLDVSLAGERVLVSVGDEERCRDLLVATLENLKEAMAGCYRKPKFGRKSVVHLSGHDESGDYIGWVNRPDRDWTISIWHGATISEWHGAPRLYEEFYWGKQGLGQRRTPGLNVSASFGWSFRRKEFGITYITNTLTVDVDGTVQLGSMPATPDYLHQWIDEGRTKRGRDAFRAREGARKALDVHTAHEWARDVEHAAARLLDGQPLSRTGDEQRCQQLLAAAVKSVHDALPTWKNQLMRWTGVSPEQVSLSVSDSAAAHWRGKPRLYEEVHWRKNPIQGWCQSRHTPTAWVKANVLGSSPYKGHSWEQRLTVSAESVVQLGSEPLSPGSLREWFRECVADLQRLAWSDLWEQWIGEIPKDLILYRSGSSDFFRANTELFKARRLLNEEIESWSRQNPAGFRAVKDLGRFKWYGTPRLVLDRYRWLGDPDTDNWEVCNDTLGYWWTYIPADGVARDKTNILLTVDADGEAELSTSKHVPDNAENRCPATVENFRAIINRIENHDAG